MGMRSHLLGILAAAAAFGLSPLQAHAGTFSISPLRVELSSAAQTGVLTAPRSCAWRCDARRTVSASSATD
jgi:hypothetical protein